MHIHAVFVYCINYVCIMHSYVFSLRTFIHLYTCIHFFVYSFGRLHTCTCEFSYQVFMYLCIRSFMRLQAVHNSSKLHATKLRLKQASTQKNNKKPRRTSKRFSTHKKEPNRKAIFSQTKRVHTQKN